MSDDIATPLLDWWDMHGRKDLPWQQAPNAYRIWVSEIMLQQTQVATVERYFDRFMSAFPDVTALAAAEQDAVLHLWSGLGYYSRARNLHKAARVVVADYSGQLPQNRTDLEALPGIGRSTAGAILALSAGQRQPILDGNAKRVLARYFAVDGWSGASANLKRLWTLAEACTPRQRVANYTQAIMDLGATVCRRGRPDCDACPLHHGCEALAQERVTEIPAPKPKAKNRPRKSAVVLMLRQGDSVLLEKRPAAGIWGGLWSFPEFADAGAAESWCAARLGFMPASRREWPVVDHSFSHFDFAMRPLEVAMDKGHGAVMEGEQWLWYNTRSPQQAGLAAPVARLLAQLQDSQA